MPRGKELEQLPMSHTAPGIGEDATISDREILTSKTGGNGPFPGNVKSDSNKKN